MSTTHLDEKEVTQGSVHLDAIRGAAALIVFFNHTKALYFTSPLTGPEKLTKPVIASHSWLDRPPNGIPHGTVQLANEAVIIFFVLSGYLVGGSIFRSIRNAKWSWKTYLSKRLTRLLIVLVPALILGVLLDVTGSRHFGTQSVYTTSLNVPLDATKNLASKLHPSVILGNLIFLQTIIVPTAGTNVSLWSLASEFWYYLMFPFVVLAVHPRSAPVIRVGYFLVLCASLLFVGWRIDALFPLWSLGALVALIPACLPQRYIKLLSYLIIVLLLMSMVGVRIENLNVITAWYVIGVLTSALIYVVKQNTTRAPNGAYRRVSSYFSHISYSLYLFHVPIAVFICGLLNNPWHMWPKDPKHLFLWLLSDAFVLVIVSGLWIMFESRTDAVRERIFSRASFTS